RTLGNHEYARIGCSWRTSRAGVYRNECVLAAFLANGRPFRRMKSVYCAYTKKRQNGLACRQELCYSTLAFVALVSPLESKRSQGSNNLRPFFVPNRR